MADDAGLKRVLANIELSKKNIENSENTKVVVLVTGSEEDRTRWQKRLDKTAPHIFNKDRSTFILSLREKIGSKEREGNFLGTLLAYSRLKEEADSSGMDYRGSVSLTGMLFGRGERMSPFTQIEGDCKPAIASTAANITIDGEKTTLSQAEESLMFFTAVAGYLEKRGFRGILNKWGDETEIPSIDLGGHPAEKDPLAAHDIIKFVSVLNVTDELAKAKEWIVCNEKNDMIAQLSRNEKEALISQLKALGVKPDKDGEYYAGISLGPVAVSYQVMDILEEVFAGDIRAQGVSIDFDPYVLMAFAMRGDTDRWKAVLEQDAGPRALAGPRGMVPDFFEKISKVRETFKDRYNRELSLKVLDLGKDVFWTDIGQHTAMRRKYLALNDKGPSGMIARKVENIPDERDENGNIIINSTVGDGIEVRDSVIINSSINGTGKIKRSVVKDSGLTDVDMTDAFSILSFRAGKTMLKKNSGIYRSIGSARDPLVLEEGMRHGTLLTRSGPVDMMVAESTDLRDKDNTYNVPIFANKISFGEAYNEMFGVSAEELEKRREGAIDAVSRGKN